MTDRLVIGLTGLAGSGKSTVADHLVNAHGFTRVRFSAALKAMMRAMGLSDREIEGDLKEVPCALLGGKTPRYAMQTIGTEWGRDLIHKDLWTNIWKAKIATLDRVVAEDTRFPNEFISVRQVGGILVEVQSARVKLDVGQHESEAHRATPDCVLRNDADIDLIKYRADLLIAALTHTAKAAA